MPNRDGTGPDGTGPTGWGLGGCRPGARYRGYGRGARGFGRGIRRGFGRSYAPRAYNREEEIAALKAEKEAIEAELEELELK